LDAAIDIKDPNYDSDMLDDDNIVLREITPESSDEELKVIIRYYLHVYVISKKPFKIWFKLIKLIFFKLHIF